MKDEERYVILSENEREREIVYIKKNLFHFNDDHIN